MHGPPWMLEPARSITEAGAVRMPYLRCPKRWQHYNHRLCLMGAERVTATHGTVERSIGRVAIGCRPMGRGRAQNNTRGGHSRHPRYTLDTRNRLVR